MKPTFFKTPAAFRAWLETHQATATELWVGYYKKGSGQGGLVYQEALDQALCFGWIDGQVRSIDGDSYMQRFTPRRKGSAWSAVNVRKAQALVEAGLMTPAGLAAFRARIEPPPERDRRTTAGAAFDAAMLKRFKANHPAWAWFAEQAPSFRTMAAEWVTSAKKVETRASRLATLIDCAARGEKPKPFIVARKA